MHGSVLNMINLEFEINENIIHFEILGSFFCNEP